MFAPITAPAFIQTVHGLTYRVSKVSSKEEDEDPQQSRKSNRLEKRNPKQDDTGLDESA